MSHEEIKTTVILVGIAILVLMVWTITPMLLSPGLSGQIGGV
jgi:hypothetical protein